jgi:hypothetical protein
MGNLHQGQMIRLSLACILLAACAAPAASGENSASSPSASTPASHQSLATFASARYGYSVQYPADWTVTPASESWAHRDVLLWGDPALDELRGDTARLVAASRPLKNDESEESWLDWYAKLGACNGPDPAEWPEIPVGGQVGIMSAGGCTAEGQTVAAGGKLYDVVVFLNGTAYTFTFDGLVDQSFVESVLATVQFD